MLISIDDSLCMGLAEISTSDEFVATEYLNTAHKIILRFMSDYGVTTVHPIGEVFDPEYHEALSLKNSHDAESNVILSVTEKGYIFDGRLVRPAKVVVSK